MDRSFSEIIYLDADEKETEAGHAVAMLVRTKDKEGNVMKEEYRPIERSAGDTPTLAGMPWELRVMSNGYVLPMTEGSYGIGRSTDNDIVLSDSAVSRHHASVVLEGEECFVVDNNSGNGVFVNGQLIPAGEKHPLRPGDVLEFDTTHGNMEKIQVIRREPELPEEPVEEPEEEGTVVLPVEEGEPIPYQAPVQESEVIPETETVVEIPVAEVPEEEPASVDEPQEKFYSFNEDRTFFVMPSELTQVERSPVRPEADEEEEYHTVYIPAEEQGDFIAHFGSDTESETVYAPADGTVVLPYGDSQDPKEENGTMVLSPEELNASASPADGTGAEPEDPDTAHFPAASPEGPAEKSDKSPISVAMPENAYEAALRRAAESAPATENAADELRKNYTPKPRISVAQNQPATGSAVAEPARGVPVQMPSAQEPAKEAVAAKAPKTPPTPPAAGGNEAGKKKNKWLLPVILGAAAVVIAIVALVVLRVTSLEYPVKFAGGDCAAIYSYQMNKIKSVSFVDPEGWETATVEWDPESGQMSSAEVLNSDGTTVIYRISGSTLENQKVTEVEFHAANGALTQLDEYHSSGITRVYYKSGKVSMEQELNKSGEVLKQTEYDYANQKYTVVEGNTTEYYEIGARYPYRSELRDGNELVCITEFFSDSPQAKSEERWTSSGKTAVRMVSEWNSDGNLTETARYENGRVVETATYDSDGTVAKKVTTEYDASGKKTRETFYYAEVDVSSTGNRKGIGSWQFPTYRADITMENVQSFTWVYGFFAVANRSLGEQKLYACVNGSWQLVARYNVDALYTEGRATVTFDKPSKVTELASLPVAPAEGSFWPFMSLEDVVIVKNY